MSADRIDVAAPCDLLFLYGTLRRGCAGHEARRLAKESAYLGEAQLRGRLYRVAEYPALVTDDLGGPVTGDLVRLFRPYETLIWLDAHEETGHGFAEPWEYRRVLLNVGTSAGARLAWIYVYGWPVAGLVAIAGGDWLKG